MACVLLLSSRFPDEETEAGQPMLLPLRLEFSSSVSGMFAQLGGGAGFGLLEKL